MKIKGVRLRSGLKTSMLSFPISTFPISSFPPLPQYNPNQFNQINQFNQNQIGHNGGVANAGNGIDPNAANPVINANPNRTTSNTNPDPILVTPQ